MTRVVDVDFLKGLGPSITEKVIPILESTNEVLPELSKIDRSLYTTVTLPMAAAYSMATATVTESMAGAAECFRGMNEALASCAKDAEESDQAVARLFKN
ncbi:hypothetical protein [Glycomyces albidus]|uniref:ESX-1 secretion-associated protein n=1 Tax=Glycomyces albidus TaxID=2656774 RepID=A0A6L5GGM4_9ACTN|nr:hypothetical protein [Glycomyces albidus]MQM28523.1 hypothetical protein [Glycomyces albidus]